MTHTSEIARQFCPHCGAWMDVPAEHWKCEVVAERREIDEAIGGENDRAC